MHTQTTFNAPADPFIARFGVPLPRGLREEATGLGWAAFCQVYEPGAGPARLGQWTEIERPADGITAPRAYRATMAIGGRIETSTATASGPVGALTAMLAERGIRAETLNFHQLRDGAETVTFIRCGNGIGTCWAMGRAADAELSALRALIAGVNRLAG